MPGGEGAAQSGFDVSSYQSVMKGTEFGPMSFRATPKRAT